MKGYIIGKGHHTHTQRKKWEFSGGPEVWAQHFHCWAQVQSSVRELRSSNLCVWQKRKRKKENRKETEENMFCLRMGPLSITI